MGQNDHDIDTKEPAKKVNTPYDDVFRTLLNDCRMLLLPVLNEVFGEEYTGNEQILYSKNEHYLNKQDGEEDERITDASFVVVGKVTKSYLFECQSTSDSSMLVRIFEYATQIALDEGAIIENKLKVTIPNSAVLFLRSTRNTPDKMQIEIETPGGSVSFDVFVMKVKEYDLNQIFEKDLLFLIPFYIFNYGSQKQLEELEEDSEKLEALENEYQLIVERLNALTEEGKLSAYYRMTILEMSGKVVENLAAQYEKVVKGVKDIMGGTVLDYKAKDILREGEMAGKKEMVINMHKDGVKEDLIAKYANVSIELVRKWIGLQPV
ncbi:MAG: hypothetical protein LUE16_05040 [Lachnospiraceae bacterium]|nr:hypothetical protein [Lachnospiraceae bacterium]